MVKRWRWITLHAHGLAGVNRYHLDTGLLAPLIPPVTRTDFAWMAGGGVDLNFNRRVGMRLIQIDVGRVERPALSPYQPTVRAMFIAGIVFKWGDVRD